MLPGPNGFGHVAPGIDFDWVGDVIAEASPFGDGWLDAGGVAGAGGGGDWSYDNYDPATGNNDYGVSYPDSDYHSDPDQWSDLLVA